MCVNQDALRAEYTVAAIFLAEEMADFLIEFDVRKNRLVIFKTFFDFKWRPCQSVEDRN